MSESQDPLRGASAPDDQPKIVVDDDWKTQVEAEREALRRDEEQAKHEPGGSTRDAPPPASIESLVSMLAMQALAALGQFADPAAKQVEVDFPLAEHMIDTLEVLREKTKGNLADQESEMLSSMLQQLRMAYVSLHGAAHSGDSANPPGDA